MKAELYEVLSLSILAPFSSEFHNYFSSFLSFSVIESSIIEVNMKALIVGGSGVISTYVVKRLLSKGWEVWVLNRGRHSDRLPEGVKTIEADIHNEDDVRQKLGSLTFDTVSEFNAFTVSDVERDWRLFSGRTRQYLFTSSASAYLKPCSNYVITEGTTLQNRYWEYSRNKALCEKYLMDRNGENGTFVTNIRPSHTYCEYSIPFGLHGVNGPWQQAKRMIDGKRVIVPGDGTSLWTLTHSLDFAVGYTGLMGNTHAYGEAFHITGDEVLTWNQIYETVAEALGVEFRPCYVPSDFLARTGKKYGYDFEGALLGDKANSLVFDNSKLKRVVPEMRTTVLFHEGVRRSVEYFLTHPERQKEDRDFDAYSDRVIAAMEEAEKRV